MPFSLENLWSPGRRCLRRFGDPPQMTLFLENLWSPGRRCLRRFGDPPQITLFLENLWKIDPRPPDPPHNKIFLNQS